MPEIQEVFQMATQKVRPDPGFVDRQRRNQQRHDRNRKIGSYVLVAAIVAAIAVISLASSDGPEREVPADTPSVVPEPTGGFTLIDVATGAATGTGIDPSASSSGFDVSPDGTRVVYVDYAPDDTGDVVHVADLDGSNVRAFERTTAPGDAEGPRWSPDGTTVVYQGQGGGQRIGNLYLLDVTTGKVTQLTDLEEVSAGIWYMAPTFSADGASVLFTMPTAGRADQRWDLWSVPATGGEPTLVHRDALGADVSPDGALIAYTEWVGKGFAFGDLYVVGSDGTGARKVVEGATEMPRWSPDSSRIVYADSDRKGVFVVDVETGETHRVLDRSDWAEWVDDDTIMVSD